MVDNNNIRPRKLSLDELCSKFPRHDKEVIKCACFKFKNDSNKILRYLSGLHSGSSSGCDRNMNIHENGNSPMYSFVSANSESDISSRDSPIFRNSSELNKISMQNAELKKLDGVFNKTDNIRNELKKEYEYLYEVQEKRCRDANFPSVRNLEVLECSINHRTINKSMSYTNNIGNPRWFPDDLNHQNSIPTQLNNPRHSPSSSVRRNSPSVYVAPIHIDDHIQSYQNQNGSRRNDVNPNLMSDTGFGEPVKRNSAHFPRGIFFPTKDGENSEASNSRSHRRQKSYDSWDFPDSTFWRCPVCHFDNITPNCSNCTWRRQ